MTKSPPENSIPRDLRRFAPPKPYEPVPLRAPIAMLVLWLTIFFAWLVFVVIRVARDLRREPPPLLDRQISSVA